MRRIPALIASLLLLATLSGCEAKLLQTSAFGVDQADQSQRGFLAGTTLAAAPLTQPNFLQQAEESENSFKTLHKNSSSIFSNENQNGLFEAKNSPKSLHVNSKVQQNNKTSKFLPGQIFSTNSSPTLFSFKQDFPQNNTAVRQDQTTSPPGPVKLVFLGDIMLGRHVRELMERNGLDYPFEKMDESYLRDNDLLIANLEGPVTSRAVRSSTGMVFGFFPDTVELLKRHHIDAVSQANNHTLDKQQKGYEESMTLLRQGGLTAFGHQRAINNDTAALFEIKGKKIALIGLEEVMSPIDDAAATQLIANLNSQKYRVIVFPHWGTEYKNLPNTRQKELAHKFIDAGAYAVIGHHPHVPQAYENYNGHPIFYSLGNAIFDQYWSQPTQEGLSLILQIGEPADWLTTSKSTAANRPNPTTSSPNNSLQPVLEQLTITLMPISLPGSQMALMEGSQRENFLKKFASYGEHEENERKSLEYGTLTLTIPF